MLKFSTNPLVRADITQFFSSAILEGSAETACPDSPRSIPGTTPIPWSSAEIAAAPSARKGPLTQFAFTLTIGDLTGMDGEADAAAVFEAWLTVRRYAPVTRRSNCPADVPEALRKLVRDARMLMFVNGIQSGLIRGSDSEITNRAAEAESIKRELPGLLDPIAYPEGMPGK